MSNSEELSLVSPSDSPQRAADSFTTCRTCRNCRQKKVKCDASHPRCSACDARRVECVYPQDARRRAIRTRKSDVRSLQRQIEELKKQVDGAADTLIPDGMPEDETLETHSATGSQFDNVRRVNREMPRSFHSLLSEGRQTTSRTNPQHAVHDLSSPLAGHQNLFPGDQRSQSQNLITQNRQRSPESVAAKNLQVYGATSLLHDQSSLTPLANQWESHGEEPELRTENIKAQLISNAALRRQEEFKFIYTPSIGSNIDFDGLSMNTALHLLDLHWNRSHLSYLLTYRPAVMDSLLNNGPYVNKLLLNAIYMQSSLYSDRPSPPGLDHPNDKGLEFYERFKTLLPKYLDEPTLPTVVALLTCGACLVPYGKQSAGWALSGMAYQMIIDLGCHLESQPSNKGKGSTRSTIMEQEMKKRVFWGAFVSDKFQSLFLGRPPMMRESTANVTNTYMDTFEEMEEWRPYYDTMSQPLDDCIPAYRGRPSYAISTFQSLLSLCKTASKIIDNFYSVQAQRHSQETLLQTRDCLLKELRQWNETLSPWLQFDPSMDSIPTPHQMTPHSLHWTLVILTEQAFLSKGHFGFVLTTKAAEQAKQTCIHAALNIWKLVEAYRGTFTLRRAQYGISYATYCAVLVMLQHTRHDNKEYNECIRFFWSALWEYQKGCNKGLKKPLQLLRSSMRRLKRSMEEVESVEGNSLNHTNTNPHANMDYYFDVQGGPQIDQWDYSWLHSLSEDSSMTGDLGFGIFA